MRCPFCGSEDSRVVDSRDVDDSIRRRRECLSPSCGARFTTYERVQTAALYIVKKDGRREEFSREKLLAGLRRACEKRPLAAGAVEALASDVESAVYQANLPEVPSSIVGELVVERLRELDPIAYVRFASVYRQFADLDALRDELESLTTGSRPGAAQLPLGPEFSRSPDRLRPAAPARTRTRRPVRPVQTPVALPRDAAPAPDSEHAVEGPARRARR